MEDLGLGARWQESTWERAVRLSWGRGSLGSLQCPARAGPLQPGEMGVVDALAPASSRRPPAAQAAGPVEERGHLTSYPHMAKQ